MKNVGFTLIELIIVVSIIAILAVIAIPQMMEMNIRAKISRVKTDMRTIALALECYNAEFLKYPPALDPLWGRNWKFERSRLSPLTSPLPFLSELPPDTFADRETINIGQFGYWDYSEKLSVNQYCIDGPWDAWINRPNSIWRLASMGPDQRQNWCDNLTPTFEYDPSNGTISLGDIIRWGP